MGYNDQMSIDPRMMAQLLQLQIQRTMDLVTTNQIPTSDNALQFPDMLQSLIGQASGKATAGNVIPAATLLAAMPIHSPLKQRVGSQNASDPSVYDPIIKLASAKNGIQSSLVKAVIDAESSFDVHAVSSAGAKGLMQLMDNTGADVGVNNPFDPEQNIQGGTKFLGNLMRKYNGNESVALAAYNCGPGRVDQLGITNDQQLSAQFNQLPQETQHYVNKVLDLKQGYQV